MPPASPVRIRAIASRLDFGVLHALRARRAARETDAAGKLTLLRRLRERALLHDLPETRVEQSWNEQLFAGVLGYRTLLSHDALPFHVLPKNLVGPRRYDDFSLGFFGLERDLVLGTAELKSPGNDLDKPQTGGNYKGQTPVEQAFSAARAHGGSCRWILVSNFCELRLYDLRDPDAPLVVVDDLREIRNPDDLALLRAHFDAAALLGDPGKENADMSAALDADHLSRPLPARDDHCRLVLRFTLDRKDAFPLFRVEKAAREAAAAAFERLSISRARASIQLQAKDGWIAADEPRTTSSPALRFAASRFGELQLSAALPASPAPTQERGVIAAVPVLDPFAPSALVDVAIAFTRAVAAFCRMLFGKSDSSSSTSRRSSRNADPSLGTSSRRPRSRRRAGAGVDIPRALRETSPMGEAAQARKLSPEEYLALERASELKHEYADGEIFAMSGGTFEHSAVAANIGRLLGNALGGRGCTRLTSDMRIKIAGADRYVYPDGSVVCGRPDFEDDKRDTLLNPLVVIEVLSDSSEAYDRGDKFAHYQTVPSVREYVLASQKAPRIEVFTRQDDGSWLLRIYGPGERVALSAVGCDLAVDDVYAGVLAAAGPAARAG